MSETWLKPSIPDNEIQIPGYSFVRSDRLHKKGGGTMPMFEMVFLIDLDLILKLLYLNLVSSKSPDLNARN